MDALDNYHAQMVSFLRRQLYSYLPDKQDNTQRVAQDMVSTFDLNSPKRFHIDTVQYLTADKKPHVKSTMSIVRRDSFFIKEKNYIFHFEQKETGGEFYTNVAEFSQLLNRLEKQWDISIDQKAGITNESRSLAITHHISLYQLMRNNLNNLFFDEIFIVNSKGESIYPQKLSGIKLFSPPQLFAAPDSSVLNKSSPSPPEVGNKKIRLKLSSDEYEVFIAPFTLGDEQLYITGIKESAQFQKVALKINFNWLSTFIISLLLIFTCIPLLAIFKMDVGDILTKNKVYSAGLSLILFSLIMGFTISFIRNQREPNTHPAEIQQIKKEYRNLESGLPFFLDQLDTWDTSKMNIDKTGLINEYLSFDDESRIKLLHIPKMDPLSLDFNSNRFIRLDNRDYVQYFNRTGQTDTPKFFTSAHYSQSTGKLEAVISMKEDSSLKKAITFKLDSIFSEDLERQRFLIFKARGKILYKSPSIRIPISHIQQAVEKSKWTEIISLTENNPNAGKNAHWSIPLYVNGHDYLGILSNMNMEGFDQPIWVLFLINKSQNQIFTSLTSLEAITFSLIYLLVLILMSLLTFLSQNRSIYLNHSQFYYAWFSPSPSKRPQYLLLNIIFIMDIVIFLFLYYFVPNNIFTLFCWSVLFALHASICKFLLIHPNRPGKYRGPQYNFIVISLVLWIVVWVLLKNADSMSSLNGSTSIYGIGLFMLITMAYTFYIMNFDLGIFFIRDKAGNPPSKKQLTDRIHKKFTNLWDFITEITQQKRIYSLSFFLWAILIGFLPGYLIHRKIYVQEQYIWKNLDSPKSSDLIYAKDTLREWSDYFETARRITFNRITDQIDPKINKFISPQRDLLLASFERPNKSHLLNRNDEASNRSKIGLLFSRISEKILNNLFLFILVLLLGLFFFKLILYLSNRIFLSEYLFTYEKDKLPENLSQSKHNFLICTDNEKAKPWIEAQFAIPKNKLLPIDLEFPIDIKAILSDNYWNQAEAVLLENIHLPIKLGELRDELAKIIQKTQEMDLHLFVTSGKSFRELIYGIPEKDERLAFSELFAPFLIHTIPVNFQLADFTLKIKGTDSEEKEYIAILNKEINYGANAPQLSAIIDQQIQKGHITTLRQEEFEKFILMVQRYNKAYYMNIWNELSFKEKKLAYYYATEGYINYKNRRTLTEMIQKGIFTHDREADRPVLFSYSFLTFVSQGISEEEAKLFYKDERQHGNSTLIQTAAISFIFISIAVISFYDPNFLNKTSAYVSAIIGVLGTFYGLVSRGLLFLTKGKSADAKIPQE
ncbi:hypothetical protein GCM10028791_34280 [Echinicola sediminis]